MVNLKHLQNQFPNPGKVDWIGLRPDRNTPMIEPAQAIATVGKAGRGLTYRGYRINDLAEYARFEEVAYLLLYGKLPT